MKKITLIIAVISMLILTMNCDKTNPMDPTITGPTRSTIITTINQTNIATYTGNYFTITNNNLIQTNAIKIICELSISRTGWITKESITNFTLTGNLIQKYDPPATSTYLGFPIASKIIVIKYAP